LEKDAKGKPINMHGFYSRSNSVIGEGVSRYFQGVTWPLTGNMASLSQGGDSWKIEHMFGYVPRYLGGGGASAEN
jgi:hypothetical protein